ncbi:MAG: hypothetical protein K5756_02910 [Clostridiales bacterium]|nr:hypothetical protein [Clostridiales bacterium]
MKKRLSLSPVLISSMAFLLIIFSFSIASFLLPDREFSESENRYLAQLPGFSFDSLFASKFTENFEEYVVDQFPARDMFVGVKTQTEFIAGKRDTNGVFFGRDGYLINRYDKTTVNVNKFHNNLKYISMFAEKYKNVQNVDFYTMLVPSAQAIHTDKLPEFAPGLDQIAEFETVRKAVGEDGYVDVSGVFSANKDKYLFYKTDHHWTSYGAFVAYREFCVSAGITPPSESNFTIKTVSGDFYGTAYSKARLITTKPDRIDVYIPEKPVTFRTETDKETRDGLYFDEYLTKRDKYSYFLGGNSPLVKVTSNAGTGRNLLIIRDSYAHCFAPFAANDFDNVYLIDLRYYNGKISEFIGNNSLTDVLILYGMETLKSDTSLVKLTK